MNPPILKINKLNVSFKSSNKTVTAANEINLNLQRGETTALVGESGSGKSVTALSILGLLPYPNAFHKEGQIIFNKNNLLNCNNESIRKIRGNKISMIFQEPMMSLNPLHTIEKQIKEIILLHNNNHHKNKIKVRILELLALVKLENAEQKLRFYPHQLSGGQRQRVMIAIAIANNPDILLADEPTTALDVTIQSQILSVLEDLKKKLNMSILLITHDLNIVKKYAKYTNIMYKSKLIESGLTKKIFKNPQHNYTLKLLKAKPKPLKRPIKFSPKTNLLKIVNLKVYFPIKKGILRKTIGHIKAVDNISLSLLKGTTLGIVGESGSGKTTLGQAILKLIPSQGDIIFKGINLNKNKFYAHKNHKKNMQFVFQDPYSSLSPRLSIYQIIAEGLIIHKIGNSVNKRRVMVKNILRDVGLEENSMDKYPHEFSGGQRQRIAIARSLILKPELIVLDEPTSALDMNTQVQIVKLLLKLQKLKKLTYIFISHDLNIIRAISDNILVMQNGNVVEQNITDKIFNDPQHQYTKSLIKASM